MRTRTITWTTLLVASALPFLLTGCTGELRSVGDIYRENGKASFNELAQRQGNIGLPSDQGDATLPSGPDTPSTPAAPAGQGALTIEQTLGVVTESRCHPGDLDNGQADFWNKLPAMLGNGDAVDGRAYTFTLEAADGTLLGSVDLGTAQLINAAQQQKTHALNKLTVPFSITVPAHLVSAGSFNANLFACVDANHNGSCADEDVTPVTDADGLPGFGFDLPGQDKPFDSRLMATLALEAVVKGSDVLLKPVEAADKGGPWGDASDFTADLLKNMKFGGAGDDLDVDTVLKLKLAVRSGDPMCAFSARDSGCFVAGTTIGVPGRGTLPVERLGRGAQVLTADGRTAASLRSVVGPEAEPVITFRTRGHVLTVTSKHPVLTQAGLKLARDVTAADKLVAAEGNRHVKIEAITRAPYQGMVFNFALPGEAERDHLVVAEGLIVGDLVLQQRLAHQAR